MRIFIIFFCVSSGWCLLFANAQTYSFSENPVDWSQPGSTCTPATPTIRYSSIYDHSFWFLIATENSPQIDDEKVWVGYYTSNHVFKYEGCMKEKPDVTSAVESHRVSSRPGACFTACKRSTFFGMRFRDNPSEDHNCFCYAELPNEDLYQTKCTMKCTQPSVACGNYNHISIYSEANTNMSITPHSIKPGDCVSYIRDGNTGQWLWTLCDISLRVLCEVDNSLSELTNKEKDWLKSSKYCFTHKQYPASVLNETITTYNNIAVLDDTSFHWIGLFRDTVIHTFKETESVAPEQYGYLEVVDGIVYLKFIPVTGEQRKHRVLCDQGVASSTTELANTGPTNPAVNATTATVITTTVSITTLHGSSSQASASKFTQSPNENEDNVPVIVGTCVGVLVLTVFVVIAVILYKRRKNRQNTPNNKSGTISKTDINVINIDYLDNSLSEDTHPPNHLPDHPYAQVQKKKKNTNKSIATDSEFSTDKLKAGERPKSEHVYYTVDQTGGDIYNTAHAKAALPQHIDTSDPYNTLALKSESDTYDHAGSHPPTHKSMNNIYNVANTDKEEGDVTPYDVLGEKAKVQEVRDNVYNTTQEISDKDSVYDKTNIVKRSEDTQHTDKVYDTTHFDNGESMYDKTNISPKQTHIVDNIYNKTEA